MYRIVTAEHPLATLHELQTIYSLEDMYDMLEMMTLQQAIHKESSKLDK